MRLTGGVVTRCNPLYEEAREDFNRAIQKYPCVMVFCYSEKDVRNAVRYAWEEDIPFRIRGGRHDYEGNSSVTNGLVIDISNINYTFIDEDTCTAKLGGGITSGKMYADLVNEGYTIPSGVCGDVGFCGLTSVGGVGFASRYLGLACDNLLEIEMINYRGEKITANNKINEDLFWAVRGGLASNFGVVISMVYKITPVDCASVYVIKWNPDDFVKVMDVWQDYTPFVDWRLSTGLQYRRDHAGIIQLESSGQFFGEELELMELIKPLIDAAEPISVEVEMLPYKKVLEKWASGCTGPRKFKASGSFMYKGISHQMMEFMKKEMDNAPKGKNQFYEFIGLSGAVSSVGKNETAFVHREALYLIEVEAVWEEDYHKDRNVQWVNHMKKGMSSEGVGTYRGFTDFDLLDWWQQYYGDNYCKLRRVKSKYDPCNLFKFPQSIKPL